MTPPNTPPADAMEARPTPSTDWDSDYGRGRRDGWRAFCDTLKARAWDGSNPIYIKDVVEMVNTHHQSYYDKRGRVDDLPTPADAMEAVLQRQWLFDFIVDQKHLMAEAGSPTNLIFEQLEEAGLVKCYDSMFGNRYYSLTDKGREELSPAGAEKRAAEACREAMEAFIKGSLDFFAPCEMPRFIAHIRALAERQP